MGRITPRRKLAAPRQTPGMVWAWAWSGQHHASAAPADSVVQGGLVRVHPNLIPPEKI